MIATLIGVLLAVMLSNLESERKERIDTIKLLHSATSVVEGTFQYVERLESTIRQIELDTINFSPADIKQVKEEPLPYPDMMENIISNELVSKNVSEFTHSRVYHELINLRKLNKYHAITSYKRFIQELLLLIELEIQFQHCDVSERELQPQFKLGIEKLDETYPF